MDANVHSLCSFEWQRIEDLANIQITSHFMIVMENETFNEKKNIIFGLFVLVLVHSIHSSNIFYTRTNNQIHFDCSSSALFYTGMLQSIYAVCPNKLHCVGFQYHCLCRSANLFHPTLFPFCWKCWWTLKII